MKKLTNACIFILAIGISMPLFANKHCGSKEGIFNEASSFLIPEHFPPESPLLRDLLPSVSVNSMDRCSSMFGSVSLGKSCKEHDDCYDTLGSSKKKCDEKLLAGWILTCKSTYKPKGSMLKRIKLEVCRSACINFVNMMSKAQTFDKDGFCPSCTAFESAQEAAQNQ